MVCTHPVPPQVIAVELDLQRRVQVGSRQRHAVGLRLGARAAHRHAAGLHPRGPLHAQWLVRRGACCPSGPHPTPPCPMPHPPT